MGSKVLALLPRGGLLPDSEWRRRHRAMLVLLAANAIALPLYGMAVDGYGIGHNLLHGAIVASYLAIAAPSALSRRTRTIFASLGLLTSAALLVHISRGLIEAHFYFFVVIVVLTLYEDWLIFLLAIGYVLLHHGVMGMIDPKAVYHSPDQWSNPWKWAGIHALFVAGAGIASVIAWRLNEDVRADMRATQRELDRAASTDSLTGLRNRRCLMDDLERAVPEATEGDSRLLALFDLNGFKAYNDTFGHPAGDALLARLARRLESVADVMRAEVYRLGGDEFCLLARASAEALEPVEQLATAALSERGDGFHITSACGSVVIPTETAAVKEALRIADYRMYARKNEGRPPASAQSKDVLLRALTERYPDMGDHLSGVAELVDAVATRLGIEGEDRLYLRQAAELHDIGKVAIPDAILSKPGPLDPDELDFIQRHTVIGERIISAAPALAQVATLVRSSHERWDGRGYPDRLAAAEIPLGARVIAVCDAFDAMISDRPYQARRSVAEALAELRGCSGSQFDPRVVDAFGAVMAARAADPLTAPRQAWTNS